MEIIRGDTKELKFQRRKKIDNQVITTKPDKMYFTVKYSYESKEPVLQKTLDNGITFNAEDNYYYMTINPEDTDKLQFRDYVYDLEIIVGNKKTTLAIGDFKISKEVTHANNEV